METSRCSRASAGAIIKDSSGRALFILRARFPIAWACPAGHTEDGEAPETAVRREVKEETNLSVVRAKLILHEIIDNPCRRGAGSHEWFFYECMVDNVSTLTIDPKEAVDARWLSKQDYEALQLTKPGIEPVWQGIVDQFPNAFWGE